MSALSRARN